MQQVDYIKELAKYGLENDQENLLVTLNQLIEHSKQSKKTNFALQLQSILKESLRQQHTSGIVKFGSAKHVLREDDREVAELIIEKLTSDYTFDNLVCSTAVREELTYLVKEYRSLELLRRYDLPVSNKILLYGPSGCGKTLAAYVLAGELRKMMVVINLGAIVSSKLGETSKNLAKLFRHAASEDCIIFLDEFDTLGKIRDYGQDHGEMKRVVNTLLQLFDYLPQSSIVIAATNQQDMIDEALTRRFDINLSLGLPTIDQIQELIEKVVLKSPFSFDDLKKSKEIIQSSIGLSYYAIQKTLITAIKRSLFMHQSRMTKNVKIDTKIWDDLIKRELKFISENKF